jgi:hypothetical protein
VLVAQWVLGRFNATHFGHHDIHHHHVGFDIVHAFKSGFTACRLVDFPMWLPDQQGPEGVAHKLLVIDEEDFGWHGHIAPGQGVGRWVATQHLAYTYAVVRVCTIRHRP